MNNKNILIFFLIAFVLHIIITICSHNTPFKLYKNTHILLSSLLYSIILVSIIYFLKNNQESYRMLEISPAKKCSLGPYTWGSPDSDTYKFCTNPKNFDAIQEVSCSSGFLGAPVHFEYTAESDDMWENTRCS
jgi:hypothetical protein